MIKPDSPRKRVRESMSSINLLVALFFFFLFFCFVFFFFKYILNFDFLCFTAWCLLYCKIVLLRCSDYICISHAWCNHLVSEKNGFFLGLLNKILNKDKYILLDETKNMYSGWRWEKCKRNQIIVLTKTGQGNDFGTKSFPCPVLVSTIILFLLHIFRYVLYIVMKYPTKKIVLYWCHYACIF